MNICIIEPQSVFKVKNVYVSYTSDVRKQEGWPFYRRLNDLVQNNVGISYILVNSEIKKVS